MRMSTPGIEGSKNGGAEDAAHLTAQLGIIRKEGERILGPTRRPDGTLRKPIRIRAGYVPRDEVAIYQSKGSLWRKEMAAIQEEPTGYDPVVEAKPKSKSAKRNERKKEKRQQAALEKGKNLVENVISNADGLNNLSEKLDSIASQMNGLSVSGNATLVEPLSDSTMCSTPADQAQDVDKKIRALKKKIQLTEAQQQKTSEKDLKLEQLEKVAKLEVWRNELKLLEDKRAKITAGLS